MSDGAFHDASALDHLGEKHVAITEEFADDFHAVHQRALDYFEGAIVFEPCFLGVGIYVRNDTFDKRVREAFLDCALAPVVFYLSRFFFCCSGNGSGARFEKGFENLGVLLFCGAFEECTQSGHTF